MSEFAEQNFPLPNQAEGIDELTVEEAEGHVKVAERPHPLTPLVDGWLFVVAVIVFFGQDFFQEFVSGRLRMSDIRQLTLADKGFWIPFAIALGILVLAVLISLASWWFTRFVVDDDEVRIERTFINHQSQRIAFSKIQSVDIKQPLVARIFGLASLSIDVGADSSKKIQYLKRDRAYKMRDFLMARANRVQASTRGFDAPPPQGPASPSDGVARSGIFEDVLGSDQIVVKVPIQRLIGSIVMSMGTIWSIMFIVFFVALGLLLPGEAAFAGLVGLLPVVFGYFGWIMKELKEGFNYTLTWTSSGLKTTHGLTELISRSVPVHRIQGVQISQPLPWRIFGWKRVRIDVLGHGVDSEDATGGILLLPVGNDDEVRRVLEVAVPQLGLKSIELRPAGKKARWIRWFDAQTFKWGYNDKVIVATGHIFNHKVDIVPHARVQEVRLSQGILRRALGLADVHAENTSGPVDLVARLLDAEDARQLALNEPSLMRAARSNMLEGANAADAWAN